MAGSLLEGSSGPWRLTHLPEVAQFFVNTKRRCPTRWVAPTTGGVAFYVAQGPVIREAWKLPSSGWNGWTAGQLVPLGALADREVWGGANLLQQTYLLESTLCLAYCRDKRGGAATGTTPATVFLFVSAPDGSNGENETAVRLPKDYLGSLMSGSRAFDHAGKTGGTSFVTESTVVQIALNQARDLAERRQLASSITTYWDNKAVDGAPAENCQSPSDPDIRRCADLFPVGLISGYSPPTWSGPEKVDGFRVDWRQAYWTPAEFWDRLSAKGRVYPEQATPDLAGRELVSGYLGLLKDRLDSTPPSSIRGDAWAAYDFTPPGQGSPSVHLAVKKVA